MKTIGLLLVLIGVGLAAAFGSQLHNGVKAKAEREGRLRLLVRDASVVKSRYCGLAAEQADQAAVQQADGCPPVATSAASGAEPPAAAADPEATVRAKPGAVSAARGAWQAAKAAVEDVADPAVEVQLQVLTRKEEGVKAPPAWTEVTLDKTYIDLAVACTMARGPEAEIQFRNPKGNRFFVRGKMGNDPKAPALRQITIACFPLELGENVPAMARVRGWFDQAGIPFIIGFLLICIGGIIARKAARAEVLAAAADASDGEARDFGQLLSDTRSRVQALVQTLEECTQPNEGDLDTALRAIEAIQISDLGPMIDTREQLVLRFGMGGFADIFGPFSGAERYLNRAWSALVDRYWEEGVASLKVAIAQLGATEVALKRQVAAVASASTAGS